MSARRPRVKAAAILKPRRPLTSNELVGDNTNHTKSDADSLTNVSNEETTEQLNVTNQELKIDAKPTITDTIVVKSPNNASKLEQNIPVIDPVESKPETSKAIAIPKPSNPSVMPTPFRRISAPPVNVANRRKSLISADARSNFGSPKYIKSPSYSFVRDAQTKDTKPNASPHHNANTKQTNGEEEIFSPAATENDECFKSPPFMSPIYTRRIEPSMSPFHDIYGDDYTKSPSQLSNNTKIRQRIRPTPCFASRRNSIQGSGLGGASESEDEQHRRQRHYSTSSNHSNYNPASTPQYQRNYFGLNKIPSRVRTESYSSSISDIPFSKNKRSHRSEEYQRVANAKREFNQRLNGKPPDKSRLTMYDLIYYNPLTNPMSKPAGKGDKSSDTASLSSAKTNQSRSSDSVKSEASVKTEKSETTDAVTGPVPQLKLDANGEIILDEKSLVIETTGEKEAREMLVNSDVVYDDEFSGTSGFYKRQKRTRDWLPLETLKFYRSLQTIGTDFSVMLQLFPNRSRRDLKLKFKKEEKHNMALINKALLHPKEFNVDELKLQFDKEDEEIEQKKQEWAEVRKKMATERREQLNASKKRNPNRQVSRSMRSLTVGDMVYENEFVSLPPKTKSRKQQVTTDLLEGSIKSPTDDSVFSPPSLNHNNNHVDTLPQHTYATHKLPSFIEMISSQKLHPSTSSEPDSNLSTLHSNKNMNNDTVVNIESNGRAENTEGESVHAIDLSSTSLVVHNVEKDPIVERNNGNNVQITANEPTIGQYIAKNPNLTFKGSRDIMKMDIIFENVSIEEDTSIGNAIETHEIGDEKSVFEPIETVHKSTTEEHNVADSQVERVNIDGIQYEIITIEKANGEDEHLCKGGQMVPVVLNDIPDVVNEVCIESVSDDSAIPVLSQELSEDVFDPSAGTSIDLVESVATIKQSTSQDISSFTPKIASESRQNEEAVDLSPSSTFKEESIPQTSIQNSENCEKDRKRKRKTVPVLTNSKRTRRNNSNRVPEPEQIKTEHETDNQTEEEAHAEADTSERSFLDSLVVVESQDPNEPNRTVHEVYVLDPDTKEISEKPLDLPEHVIQRIRLAMS